MHVVLADGRRRESSNRAKCTDGKVGGFKDIFTVRPCLGEYLMSLRKHAEEFVAGRRQSS